MTSKLTAGQYGFLIDEIKDARVRQLRGNSHLEAWDIRRHLIRVFGFGGFDIETKALDLVKEIESPPGSIKYSNGGTNNKTVWTVVYRAEIRLVIKAPDGTVLTVLEDGAAGDAQNQPSLGDAHDQAMKTALSQGLKRCAVNLGDQFGLSLYNGGGTQRVVIGSLVHPPQPDGPATTALPADDAPVLPEPEPGPAPEDQVAPEPEAQPAEKVDRTQHRTMHALWRELGYDGDANRDKRLKATATILGVPEVSSSAELTKKQAQTVITALRNRRDQLARTGGVKAE
ncbi:Rad52/Rad22 family DNA repair protein [Micromonospora sp. URMC 103]|uniref:Rad52/Rad22 family DNA repair protein n=1 Tax=Micromonospora sp. URMC 103 TaxID=3423406 RepID=UPI003F1C64E3